MSLRGELIATAKEARVACAMLAGADRHVKDAALSAMAAGLRNAREAILQANAQDLEAAKAEGYPTAFVDRLTLTPERIEDMAQGLEDVAALEDPIGEVLTQWTRPNQLHIAKVRVPIGVVAIIYESRPNVTSDCIGLCLKSGNAAILRGGRESWHSNQAIVRILQEAVGPTPVPATAFQLVSTTDRKAVSTLLRLREHIDVVIPRGGESLIREVVSTSRIPVIKQYKGLCHTYVDAGADLTMATEIAYNAKVQRPGVCNAMETLLVHESLASEWLPIVSKRLEAAGVELRGCAKTQRILPHVAAASAKDWSTEYLDLVLSVKVVKSVEAAIHHINRYGTRHSECIVTQCDVSAQRFVSETDAACVYVNASTRFTDGGQFGLGAEIGISTDKLHARGPVGLEELTTYKYVIRGDGQVRP